jgi:hypothetical protein
MLWIVSYVFYMLYDRVLCMLYDIIYVAFC